MEIIGNCQKFFGEELETQFCQTFSKFMSEPSQDSPPLFKVEGIFQATQPDSKFSSIVIKKYLIEIVEILELFSCEWTGFTDCLSPIETSNPILLRNIMSFMLTTTKTIFSIAKSNRNEFIEIINKQSKLPSFKFGNDVNLALGYVKDLVPQKSIWHNFLASSLFVLFSPKFTRDCQFMSGMFVAFLLEITGSPQTVSKLWMSIFFNNLHQSFEVFFLFI